MKVDTARLDLDWFRHLADIGGFCPSDAELVTAADRVRDLLPALIELEGLILAATNPTFPPGPDASS